MSYRSETRAAILAMGGHLFDSDVTTDWFTLTNPEKFYDQRENLSYSSQYNSSGTGGLVVFYDKPIFSSAPYKVECNEDRPEPTEIGYYWCNAKGEDKRIVVEVDIWPLSGMACQALGSTIRWPLDYFEKWSAKLEEK